MEFSANNLQIFLEKKISEVAFALVYDSIKDESCKTLKEIEDIISEVKNVRTQYSSMKDLEKAIESGELSILGYTEPFDILEDLVDVVVDSE